MELHEPFTHDEIVKLIDAGEMRIDRNWFDESRARARLGGWRVDSLSDLKTEEQNRLLHRREYYVSQFLAMEAADKKGGPHRSADREGNHRYRGPSSHRWNPLRRLDQGQAPALYAPNLAPLAKERHYENGQRSVVALRTRHRHSGNPLSEHRSGRS
ncbi:MAG: hypothetical protein MZV49_07380 [Rhodopseudomonas palustris]|nr:hypothetical protein [Rhodopseudomonas palustris]